MNQKGQVNWMDEMFGKKLKNFEISPSERVWENISEHLDGKNRRSGILGGWWTWLFIGILIGIGAFLLYKKWNHSTQYAPSPQETPNLNSFNEDKGSAYAEFREDLGRMNNTHNIQKASKHILSVLNTKASRISESINGIPQKKAEELVYQNKEQIVPIQELYLQKSEQKIEDENLIASSDPEFIPLHSNGPSSVMLNSLPRMLSNISSENLNKNSMVLEGCNVYKDTKSHYFVEAFYAPEIASRSFIVNNPNLIQYAEERAASEKPLLSYSSGIRASVVFGSGLTFRTGIQFSTNKERFDFVKETLKITVERKDPNGNVTTEIVEKVVMDKTYNKYRFVDIPIMLGYEKDLNDFVLSLNTGIGFNISSSQSGKIYQSDLKSFYSLNQADEGNNAIYRNRAGISLLACIGLNYKLNQRTMLMLEPSVRYYLSSISDSNYPLQQKYFFGGVNVGLRYRIK